VYSKLVEKGGMIAFHDICAGPLEVAGEVNKFWNEIKQSYAFKEIIHDRNEEGFGIGIVYS